MPAIGITGGISTGKSTFCDCLREILPGAKFFDADAVARQLVDLEEVKQELLAKFGFGIFSRNGDLNREALRAIIFQDAAKKQALELILHPRIRRQWSVEADRHRRSHAANEDRARPGRSHDQIANASRRKNQTSRSRCLEQRRSSCACGAGCEFAGTVASGKMDEKLNENA